MVSKFVQIQGIMFQGVLNVAIKQIWLNDPYAVKTGGQLATIIEQVGPKKHVFIYQGLVYWQELWLGLKVAVRVNSNPILTTWWEYQDSLHV